MSKCMRSIIFILCLCLIIPSAYAGLIELVSVSSNGEQGNSPVNGGHESLTSADGRFVVFSSLASNLAADDTNNFTDVFVHDRDNGITERVSVSSSGAQANGSSGSPSISADGRFVAFSSRASNLAADKTNNFTDVFVHDRDTGITEYVSVSSSGAQGNGSSGSPSISADGRFVAFSSSSFNLVAGDTNDFNSHVFVHDRDTGITERVSESSSGVRANEDSYTPSISADGRFVAFSTTAYNLVPGDTNRKRDIFVHDRATGITERVSVSSDGVQATGGAEEPSMSADGRFVVFESFANNLVENDLPNLPYVAADWDIFVHDRDTGVTERVSVSSYGIQGTSGSHTPSISANGRFVAFSSLASNLVADDTNDTYDFNTYDFFVHDRDTGITERVNVSSSSVQVVTSFHGAQLSISADGRFVAFESFANNLMADDTNDTIDIFVAENSLGDLNDDLTVTLRPAIGTTPVGEYIRFRARLKNNSDTTLTNCNAQIVNPPINYQRRFSYYTWPLKVANPAVNGAIDIDPGEIGEINMAVKPRVAMRREVSFEYVCDTTRAVTIPFINTLHLTGKTEPLIAEDYVYLKNNNSRTALVIDRGNGKYWAVYVTKVINAGSEPASVNLTTTSEFPTTILRQSRLCEPVDPGNGNWSCIAPQDSQVQVELNAGETKNIVVFVHANQPIDKKSVASRIYVEAHDGAGEIVAKTSMGISTIN